MFGGTPAVASRSVKARTFCLKCNMSFLPQFSLRRYREKHPQGPALEDNDVQNFAGIALVQLLAVIYAALGLPGTAYVALLLVTLFGVIHLIYALVEPNVPSGTSFTPPELRHPVYYSIHLLLGAVFAPLRVLLVIRNL